MGQIPYAPRLDLWYNTHRVAGRHEVVEDFVDHGFVEGAVIPVLLKMARKAAETAKRFSD